MRRLLVIFLVGVALVACAGGEEQPASRAPDFPPPGPPTNQPTDRPPNQQTGQPTVASPQPAQCGNGVREENEECDDGNTVNGDGCSRRCVREGVAEQPTPLPTPETSQTPTTPQPPPPPPTPPATLLDPTLPPPTPTVLPPATGGVIPPPPAPQPTPGIAGLVSVATATLPPVLPTSDCTTKAVGDFCGFAPGCNQAQPATCLPQSCNAQRQCVPWTAAQERMRPEVTCNAAGRPQPTLNVPLTIQEARIEDITRRDPGTFYVPDQPYHFFDFAFIPGINRTDEPVRLGLPLPPDSGVCAVTQLGLAGAGLGQFRVLSRYPNGNIEWVLVDTLASVAANGSNNQVSLVPGSGNYGGPALAQDLGTSIRIQTGVADFTISKTNFNLFERVAVGNRELISPGQSAGIVLTGADGTPFLASNDSAADVRIEENGPVRAVIVARGTHRSQRAAAGSRNLEFTVRMHFFRNRARADVSYSLRNASRQQIANAALRTLELVLRSTINGPSARFATHDGEYTAQLAAADRLRLFQGINDFPILPPANQLTFTGPIQNQDRWYPTRAEGYRIAQNGNNVRTGTRAQIIQNFYGEVRSANQDAITFGTKFAAGYNPQGLGIDGDGTIRIGLYPEGNAYVDPSNNVYVRFNSHETFEVMFDFSPATTSSPRDKFFAFQYPLVAKARDRDWYNVTGAIWERLVSPTDEQRLFDGRGLAATRYRIENRRPQFRIWRRFPWRLGGGNNQYDTVRKGLINFLADERPFGPAFYVDAIQRANFVADRAILRGDDFSPNVGAQGAGPADTIDVFVWNNERYETAPNAGIVEFRGDIVDGDHPHATGVGLAYYLTGDERLREAYLQFGEVMLSPNEFHWYDRAMAWKIFNFVDLSRFTKNNIFRELAWFYLDQEVLREQTVTGQRFGTDPNRGYHVARQFRDAPGLAAFMFGAIYPRAYAYFERFGAANEYQADRVRSALEGAAQHTANELWFEFSQNVGEYGFAFQMFYDTPYCEVANGIPRNGCAPGVDPRNPANNCCFDVLTSAFVPGDETNQGFIRQNDWFEGVRECYPSFLHGFNLTGDQEFLRRGELLVRGALTTNEWNFNFPEREAVTDLLQNGARYATWRQVPVQAAQLAPGRYRLSWVVPQGTQRYWLKHAPRPIVARLRFNRQTRTFVDNPAQFAPFFSATDVLNEPAPLPAGQTQTLEIGGLDPGQTHNFSLKALIWVQ